MEYQYFIWLGLLLLSLGLYGVVRFWPNGGTSKTFSQHAASNSLSVLYYILLFTITLPLFAVFFFAWFVPNYQPSVAFSVFIATGLIAQYMCTFIPEAGGRRTYIHQALAFLSALCLLLAAVSLISLNSLSIISLVVLIVSVLVMGWLLFLLVIKQARHPKVLYMQIGYFACFFASILTIVYV